MLRLRLVHYIVIATILLVGGVILFVFIPSLLDAPDPDRQHTSSVILDIKNEGLRSTAEVPQVSAISRTRASSPIEPETWNLVRGRMLLVGTNRQSGALSVDAVELLGLSEKEQQQIDLLSTDALEALKGFESKNSSVVSTEDGEVIRIEPFDASAVRADLTNGISEILQDSRASMLMEIFETSPCMREFGKFPTTIYFEEDASGIYKFNVEETRTMPMDNVTKRVSGQLKFKPATTISERTKVSPNSAQYHRYSHVLESIANPS